MRSSKRLAIALLAIVSIQAAGCTTGGPGASGAGASGATSSGAPLTRMTVTVAQAGDFMGWGALYVAAGKGYFEEQGLNVNVVRAQGGPAVLAALLSGNADFSTSTMGEIFGAVAKGQKVRVAVPLAHQSNVVCGIRQDVLDRLQLPAGADWKAKALAMKGLTIGVTSVGGSIALTTRYMLTAAGLNAESDVTLTAIGVDSSAWIAAMQNQQLDAMCSGVPIPHAVFAAKAAVPYINVTKGEVPALAGMTDMTIATTETVIQEKPEAVQRFVNAMAAAQAFTYTNPTESATIIKQIGFPKLDQGAFDLGFSDFVNAYNSAPIMTEASYKIAVDFYSFANGTPITVPFGDVWDDRFARNVSN